MPIENDWKRCEPHDPNRCQESNNNGSQCIYLSKPGTKRCPRHSASADTLAANKAANMYKLQQYQARMTEFTTHDELKNLRGEIGILRMTLEKIINQCQGDDKNLVAFSGKISDMCVKIRILIMSCQNLEIKMGLMMDRDKVMLIGQGIVDLVAKHVENPDVLDLLGNEIVKLIMDVSQGQHDESVNI